jgi:hypothetical protein
MVESLEPGKSIVFAKNTKYWDGSPKGYGGRRLPEPPTN